jgi:hypothetical protein
VVITGQSIGSRSSRRSPRPSHRTFCATSRSYMQSALARAPQSAAHREVATPADSPHTTDVVLPSAISPAAVLQARRDIYRGVGTAWTALRRAYTLSLIRAFTAGYSWVA